MRITGKVTVAGPTNVCGSLEITGTNSRLTLNGQTLTLVGNFSTAVGGVLTMSNPADRLTIGGDASFSGGGLEGQQTAGEIQLAGNLAVGGGSFEQSVATGTAVRLNGTTVQTVFFAFPGAVRQRFHDLTISNAAGVKFTGSAHVSRNLDLMHQMTVPSGVTLSGIQMLFLRGTSVLNNQGTIQTAACTKQPGHVINGTDPCP